MFCSKMVSSTIIQSVLYVKNTYYQNCINCIYVWEKYYGFDDYQVFEILFVAYRLVSGNKIF